MNLTNIFNAFMIWLLRSPLHKIASKNTLLITFPGHKSGKKYTTPVNYVIDSNVIFITSLRSRTWWKNLGGDAKINAHLQGKDLETNGEVFEDNETVKEQLMRYLQKALNMQGISKSILILMVIPILKMSLRRQRREP